MLKRRACTIALLIAGAAIGSYGQQVPVAYSEQQPAAQISAIGDYRQRNPATCSRLYLLDRESDTVRLLDGAVLPGMTWNGSPDWSPDGSRIAFDATPRLNAWHETHIAVYHVAGPRRGEVDDLGLGNAPSWSPDGEQIAFFMNHGTAGGAPGGSWVMNADGTGREHLGPGFFPNWSTDEHRIVVQVSGGDFPAWNVFDMRTGKSAALPALGSIRWQPAWSPDGERLAAITPTDRGVAVEIITVADDYSERRRVWPREGDNPPEEMQPHQVLWSPTGDELLFQVPFSVAETNLYVLSLDDENAEMRPLEKAAPHACDACYSPDGKQIIFCSVPF